MHSGLDLKFGSEYVPLNDKKLDMFRNTMKDLQLVIIDEISMVSPDMLYQVHQRLCEIFISQDSFGGKGIILVGDLLQLKPVKANYIFTTPRNKRYKFLDSVESLWSTFDVAVLTTNHRHQDGSQWANLLNRCRIGELTQNDREILEARRTINFPTKELSNACHVFYTNEKVEEHNVEKLNSIPGKLFTVDAISSYPKGYNKTLTNYGTIDSTNFKQVLQLKKQARVMLINNVNIRDSLINGQLGTVIDFIVNEQSEVSAVIVKFDNPEVGEEQRKAHSLIANKYKSENGTPIFKINLEYNVPFRRGSKQHGCKGTITQIPLKLAWSSTCHKVQGITIKRGSDLVIHGHPKIPHAMSYVMMGRCQDINDLYLGPKFDLDKIKCSPAALEENDRLNKRNIVPQVLARKFDVYMVNVRSLNLHFSDLQSDPIVQNSEIVCIVETCLKESDNNNFQMKNKIFNDASYGHGKGCAAFYPNSCVFNSKEACDQYSYISLMMYKKVQLIVIYASQNCEFSRLAEKLKKIINSTFNLVVIGDFNFPDGSSNALTKMFDEYDLIQIVDKPTHIKGNTIDHCYVPKQLQQDFELNIFTPYYTDHCALCLNFPETIKM